MARTKLHDEERRLSWELRAMERRYEGVVQQFRLDDLARKLGEMESMAAAIRRVIQTRLQLFANGKPKPLPL